MKNRILVIFFIFFFLSSCSLFQTKQKIDVKVAITPNNTVTLPQPDQLGLNKTISQIVSATYYDKNGKQKNLTSNMVIEVNSKHIVMIALSGWGSSLFKLDYDGSSIQSSSLPMPNKNIGVKQSLIEFIISQAPINVVQKMFANTDITVSEQANQRAIMTTNGKKILVIKYSNNSKKISIHNYHYNYTINITNLN
ncbi:DUF3261 domain-containing protein [Francisella uliginis]|uniref:DUF3261 domain-containing protein n=1 Tax=Francisella uliginis TaxID=573570 RepID=A0A1L4BUD3_9GAMM|nr:DUF3261 domain-containing protein [Francisella uliginis]API87447.1 hypothetical protein F7310_08780 [Francisella uliginis]